MNEDSYNNKWSKMINDVDLFLIEVLKRIIPDKTEEFYRSKIRNFLLVDKNIILNQSIDQYKIDKEDVKKGCW